MAGEDWRRWRGLNGQDYAQTAGWASPPVTVSGPPGDLDLMIANAEWRLANGTYWPNVLARREEEAQNVQEQEPRWPPL